MFFLIAALFIAFLSGHAFAHGHDFWSVMLALVAMAVGLYAAVYVCAVGYSMKDWR